jgi:Na+-driven multidrug efflux pump
MRWPVIAILVRVVVAVGIGWLLAFWFDLGLQGVFIGAAAAMATFGLIIATSLKLGAWRSLR